MKNKTLFFLLLLLFPCVVHASDFAIICDHGPFKSKDVINCQIKVVKTYLYDEISATIKDTDNLVCSTPVIGQGLEEIETTENSFKYKGQENTSVISSFSCEVKELNIDKTDQIIIDDFSYTIKGEKKTEVLRSSNLELKKIEVEDIKDDKPRDVSFKESLLSNLTSPQLSFVFSSYLTKYEIEVLNEVDKIELNPTLMDETSTVDIQGSLELSEGLNTIDIYVTSQDGEHKTCYTLYINRLKSGEEIYYPEQDASLKSLRIKGKSIGFKTDKYNYNLHLYSDESKIDMETIANYEGATVDIDKTENLKNGDIITVTVTSADGINKNKYVIKVSKDAPKKNITPYVVIALIVFGAIGAIVGFVKTTNKKAPDTPEPNTNEEVQGSAQPQVQSTVQQPSQPIQQQVDPNNNVNPVDTSNNTNI